MEPRADEPRADLLALNDALTSLAAQDPRKAELVKLRFFAGLTNRAGRRARSGSRLQLHIDDWAYAKCLAAGEMSERR